MRLLPPHPPARTSSVHYHDVRPTEIDPHSVYSNLTEPITYDASAYLDSSAYDIYSSLNTLQIDNHYENIITGYEYSDEDEYEN